MGIVHNIGEQQKLDVLSILTKKLPQQAFLQGVRCITEFSVAVSCAELNVGGTAEFLVAEPYGVVATKGKRRWVLRLTLTLDPTQQSKVDGNYREVGR